MEDLTEANQQAMIHKALDLLEQCGNMSREEAWKHLSAAGFGGSGRI